MPPEISPQKIREYYLRPEILENILSLAHGREVVPVFGEKGFGSRPSVVQFRGDLEHMVRAGATSFHTSIEHWRNPLVLANELKKQEMDALRAGWDIVFDIDAKKELTHAQAAAELVLSALSEHGIKTATVKFSGRRGFHIGVRGECMPESIDGRTLARSYPEVLQKVVFYIKQTIKGELLRRLVSMDKSLEAELKGDPYNALEIEENWSNRHLFRMPYSFNEKTWLVSVPIEPAKLREFTPDLARPEVVSGKLKFLDSFEKESAFGLVARALEYREPEKNQIKKDKKKDKLIREITNGHGEIKRRLNEYVYKP